MTRAILRPRRTSLLANACRWCSTIFLRTSPCRNSNCPTNPHKGLCGNSPPEYLSGQQSFFPLSFWERGEDEGPWHGDGTTLATTGVSEEGRRMPAKTHVVKA